MSPKDTSDRFDRSAGGLDFDDPIRDRASQLGNTVASGGPEAFFEEIENLIPDPWKEHIKSFPVTAVLIGVGVGIFLGMKKGDEILAAGSSLVAAAATTNLTSVLGRATGHGED